MCPHCRAFITTSDRVCPYCNENVGPRYVERLPDLKIGGLIPQAQFTTVLILLINAGLFIATQLFARNGVGDNIALWDFGGKYGPSIWQEHEWWRVITAGFLHGGMMHIMMNSWALYQLGMQVEELYGTARYLAIYFCATAGGFYLSARMNPGLSIGSSAGIAGLIGAMVAFGVINRSTVGRAIRNFYLQSVVFLIAMGLIPGIDNWAHMGGLAAGFCIAYIAGTPIHSSRSKEAMWRVLGTACVLMTVFCFLMVYTHFQSPNQIR